MRGFVILCVLLVAVSAYGAVEQEFIPGAIQKPGYDYLNPYYGNSINDSQAQAVKDRYHALYAAYNMQIPDEVILVAPQYELYQTYPVNESNIETAARNFLSSVNLIPVNGQLDVIGMKFAMGRTWFINFRRSIANIPVEESNIGLAISPDGHINLLWGKLSNELISAPNFIFPGDASIANAQRGLSGAVTHAEFLGQAIVPLHFGSHTEFRTANKTLIVTDEPYAEWETFVDAQNGDILQRTNKVFYDEISGDVTGSAQIGYPTDPWTDHAFFDMNLIFGGNDPITTDSAGAYIYDSPDSAPIDAYVYFRGPFLEVWNSEGNESELFDIIDPPTTFDVYWDDSNSSPIERDAWYSGTRVHHWIRQLDDGLTVMDYPMACNINVAGNCNAFWSSWTRDINFYRAGGGCPNIAQIADVVYHEYGHGVTDLQTRPLGPNGAMHEGFSDYLACTMTNQPLVGVGFFINRPYEPLRNLDNNNRYPDDWSGESHNDGLIIGGALWHTREALSPYTMGYVDSLWHFARYAMPQEFEPYFWAFVALDDDDGDISNGTPNAPVIFSNFGDRHGIGPGTAVDITANVILDTEDTTTTFTITANVNSFFPARADSVILFYDNGTGYQALTMAQVSENWQAIIPAQHNDTHVDYYVLVVCQAGFRGTAPEGAPAFHYSFYVGPDVIPPAMSLIEGPPNTINLYGPYGPFIITAEDINEINPGLVRLHYMINSEPERTANLVADTGSVYQLPLLSLDRHLYTGDTVHYYFTALDGAHHANTGRLPATGTYNLVMATSEIFEDFEDGMSRWIHDDTWVFRNDGFLSAHSIWYSSPNYPNNANSTITMDFDYDLSPYSGARVTFMRKNLLRSGDTCFVEASNDNGFQWTRVGAITGLVAPIYNQMQVDISSILDPGLHHYKIRFHFISDSESTWVGVMLDNIGWSVDPAIDGIEDNASLPQETSLLQNYPNPFNPETKIQFSLASGANVKLEIFDILGRLVTTLYDARLETGSYSITWNGTDNSAGPVSSGVYFYRLTTDQGVRQQKMTLLR